MNILKLVSLSFTISSILFSVGCSTVSSNTKPTTNTNTTNVSVKTAPSNDIVKVQKMLASVGFKPGPADGVYGRRTSYAISQFKVYASIFPINGDITAELITQLEEHQSSKSSSAIAKQGDAKSDDQADASPIQLIDGDKDTINKFLADFKTHFQQLSKRITFARVLTVTARDYDADFLNRAGLAYLTGNSVEQDMMRAALFLGAIQSYNSPTNSLFRSKGVRQWIRLTSEQQQALGHAAYETYLALGSKDPLDRLALGFLHLAKESDSQSAMLALAFGQQATRLNQNLDTEGQLITVQWERSYFEDASDCTDERISRSVTPWQPELCKNALEQYEYAKKIATAIAQEYNDELDRYEAERREKNWELMASIGRSLLIAAMKNPSNGQSADWYEQQRQRSVRQRESTWAHVGAAMFVP